MNPLHRILLSFALIASSSTFPISAQESPTDSQGTPEVQSKQSETTPNTKAPDAPQRSSPSLQETRIGELENKVFELERNLPEGPLGIALPVWLVGAPGVVSLILTLSALIQLVKQGNAIQELSRRNQNLLSKIGGIEVQLEQERTANRRMAMAAQAAKSAHPQPQSPTLSFSNSLEITQPDVPNFPQLDLQPNPQTAPAFEPQVVPKTTTPLVSKTGLINALNAGDRQALREAATAELNITSESENALAMGKSIGTELEEVAGGGSYWLVNVQGQHLLFPTDRTLKGFAAAQPSKGLFLYVQVTISQPQLMEPAHLERAGNRWVVQSMGKIATP